MGFESTLFIAIACDPPNSYTGCVVDCLSVDWLVLIGKRWDELFCGGVDVVAWNLN